MNGPLNLRNTRVLLAHGSKSTARMYDAMLRGFGVQTIQAARNPEDLSEQLSAGDIDLAIIDNSVGKSEIPHVVSSVRRGETGTSRDIPIILSYCHSSFSDVLRFRDSGANMIMSTPISVSSVYNRINWIARKPRPFVISDGYCGPCRRVSVDPAQAALGRRHDDAPKMARKHARSRDDFEIV